MSSFVWTTSPPVIIHENPASTSRPDCTCQEKYIYGSVQDVSNIWIYPHLFVLQILPAVTSLSLSTLESYITYS